MPAEGVRIVKVIGRLHVLTDLEAEADPLDVVDAALAAGVPVIQVRAKLLTDRELFALAEAVVWRCRVAGATCLIDDRVDIALASGADVLHLGQDDLPLPVARGIIGQRPVIGRSTHDLAQAAAAVDEQVDYFCVGPCWPTPTKPGRPSPGLDLVRATAELATDKPWFAIGGIDEERLPEVLAAGARRIVVVRAITDADDPRAAARRLKARLAAG